MKQINNRITITLTERGEGNSVNFMKNPNLMELAICANIIDSVMINNFPLEDIEQAKDKAWMVLGRMKRSRPINLSDECKMCEERYGSLVMCFDCCMVPLDLLRDIEIKRYKEESNVSDTE